MDDPTINRIREARHRISEECSHDPKKVVDYYIEIQKKNKHLLLVNEEKEVAQSEPAR